MQQNTRKRRTPAVELQSIIDTVRTANPKLSKKAAEQEARALWAAQPDVAGAKEQQQQKAACEQHAVLTQSSQPSASGGKNAGGSGQYGASRGQSGRNAEAVWF